MTAHQRRFPYALDTDFHTTMQNTDVSIFGITVTKRDIADSTANFRGDQGWSDVSDPDDRLHEKEIKKINNK